MSEKIPGGRARVHNRGVRADMIDPYEKNWLDRLGAGSTSEAANFFVLVDAVFVPGLHRRATRILPPNESPSLLFDTLPGCTEETRDVSPFLFRFQHANVRIRDLLEQCNGFPMVSVIETSEGQVELAQRLAAWCIVSADGQRFNFRFPDTRRLPAIFHILTDTQRAQMTGPATRWSYVERTGGWGELNLPRMPSPIADQPELDNRQFAYLVESSKVDEIISIFQSRGMGGARRHSELYGGLSLALHASEKCDSQSKLSWCDFCLRAGLPEDKAQAIAQFALWSSRTATEEVNR